MDHPPPSIIPLPSHQQQTASGVLSRAFFNDPLMLYYLPDPARRARVLPYLMRVSLRYCLFYGQVFTTLGLDGMACWLPPGHTAMGILGLLRAGMGVLPPNLGWEALRRLRQVEPAIDRIHRACVPGPHWYLMLLGVEPARQGQGIGGSLIALVLAKARAAGLPCYLETMTELDVAFYRKHGFKVVFEIELPPGSLHVWMVLKQPEE
jgi:ribosomal protein S18 acetylase RimI-like enzyme